MDRQMLAEHLTLAEAHVEQGIRHIERQREIIAELARDGHDTASARDLLRQFEETLKLHIGDRDRIVAELAQP